MRQFLKYVLATLVGLLLAGFLGTLIFTALLVSPIKKAIKNDKKEKTIAANSILHVKFNTPVQDRPSDDDITFARIFNVDVKANDGLKVITNAIQRAAEDDNIKGMYLDMSVVPTGFANMSALDRALDEFKASGKFIVSYADYYNQKAYGLASVADEMYMHPQGVLDFKGLSANVMYFKGMLDKLDLEPKIYYAGKFKSATEPFRRTNMSEENRKQVTEYISDLYDDYLTMIADNRNMKVAYLRDVADNYKIRIPQDAVDLKLLDGLKYDDEMIATLKDKVGYEEDEDLDLISLKKYIDAKGISHNNENKSGKNTIAVLYAEGSIMGGDGKGKNEGIYGDKYAKLLNDLRNDDKVKAVVLRVNSPGGSAFASEKIWREVELYDGKKPIVVSMGNVAASGGYYIACNADKIYAEPNTITGSIGVFATLLNTEKFLKNKLGITTDQVKTGKYSDFPNPTRKWTAEEEAMLQTWVDDIYGTFLQRVADGRQMNVEQVNELAQGRVWSGKDALDIGLVDEMGTLEDAVAYAVEQAGVDAYKLKAYPSYKSPFEEIMEMFDMNSKAENLLKEELGEAYLALKALEEFKSFEEPQARLPFELEIN